MTAAEQATIIPEYTAAVCISMAQWRYRYSRSDSSPHFCDSNTNLISCCQNDPCPAGRSSSAKHPFHTPVSGNRERRLLLMLCTSIGYISLYHGRTDVVNMFVEIFGELCCGGIGTRLKQGALPLDSARGRFRESASVLPQSFWGRGYG